MFFVDLNGQEGMVSRLIAQKGADILYPEVKISG